MDAMKVLISVDMEGVSGVTDPEDVLALGAEYQRSRELMTEDAARTCHRRAAGGRGRNHPFSCRRISHRSPGAIHGGGRVDRTDATRLNLEMIRSAGIEVVAVEDRDILAAMGKMVAALRIVVEPSGALGLAALRTHPRLIGPGPTGLLVSGGNASPHVLAQVVLDAAGSNPLVAGRHGAG